jgi:gamma-butyrobetaine dioxygenase
MDLLYFANPPTVQILHCLRNSVEGGASFWADSFRAANDMYHESENRFSELTKYPVTYHYDNAGEHYHYSRPTFEVEEHSTKSYPQMKFVNYSPPFQAPYEHFIGTDARGKFRGYISALKNFVGKIQKADNKYERRMRPGEAMIFNNRRVLHARHEFDPTSGERWFKGAYLDADPWQSRLRVLERKFAVGEAQKVGRGEPGDEHIS